MAETTPTAEQLIAELAAIDSPTVANAVDRFHVRHAPEGVPAADPPPVSPDPPPTGPGAARPAIFSAFRAPGRHPLRRQ